MPDGHVVAKDPPPAQARPPPAMLITVTPDDKDVFPQFKEASDMFIRVIMLHSLDKIKRCGSGLLFMNATAVAPSMRLAVLKPQPFAVPIKYVVYPTDGIPVPTQALLVETRPTVAPPPRMATGTFVAGAGSW